MSLLKPSSTRPTAFDKPPKQRWGHQDSFATLSCRSPQQAPKLQDGAMTTSLQVWHTAHDKLLVLIEGLHTILECLASYHLSQTQVPAEAIL